MSKDKKSNAMEQAMKDALASVERIERERGPSDQEPIIETELEMPESEDEPEQGVDASAANGADDDSDSEVPSDEAPEDTAEELEKVRGQLLRLAADFENFRKRSQREREDIRQFGIEGVLRDIVSVVDNLERALAHADDGDDPFVQGVHMIGKQLVDALGQHGARPFDSQGQPFDPEQHEAMSQAPSDEVAPGTVLHQLEKGYWLHDRLLRPAKVIVATAMQPKPETQPEGDGAAEEPVESPE